MESRSASGSSGADEYRPGVWHRGDFLDEMYAKINEMYGHVCRSRDDSTKVGRSAQGRADIVGAPGVSTGDLLHEAQGENP